MRTFAIALLAGVSALAATAARADSMTATAGTTDLVQQVRMVCNDYGRCWHEPSDRVIIRRSYDSYPDRYYERRHYREYGPGVGFHAPGVDIGVGVDRY